MRKTRCLYIKHSLTLLSLAAFIWVGAPASAQSASAPEHNTTVRELASFDGFMDGHPEIAEQLRKDPSLVQNEEFVEKHPVLQQYLQEHPGVREEIRENPNAFMHQEQRFEGQETGRELTNLNRFMDTHPEIAEQLRKNPSLVNNPEFVEKHPALQQFLQEHGGVAQELRQNSNAFMQQEQRFDQREDGRDGDGSRREMASMDRFLDGHPEIAEQLRKDPSLVKNTEFVEKHPALQSYLQQHPQVREEITSDPNAFMRQEQRFDREEGWERRNGGFDRDAEQREIANFGQFLGDHANIAQQISKDPSLLNNGEYMENHPELRAYLQAHPGVQEEFNEHPQAFMQSVQQVNKPAPKPDTLAKPLQPQR
jgi:phage-related protein